MSAAALAACVLALRAFAWPAGIEHWRGLPDGCTRAAAAHAFVLAGDEWRNPAQLGDDRRRAAWLSATGGGFPKDGPGMMKVWLDGDRLLALEAGVPPDSARDVSRLTARFGAPTAKLDFWFGGLRVRGGEWVYPKVGLTIYVDPDSRKIFGLVGWPPGTVDDYRKNFRPPTGPIYK